MSKNIVVLTGAGISAESGLRTFRDNDGLWENHRVEEVATPEAFALNPEFVLRFYNERRAALSTVEPNLAHFALASAEQRLVKSGGSLTLVTQNIDDLHQRAGSERVLPMHGELLKARCTECTTLSNWQDDLLMTSICPHCGSKGTMRPHVVWFGEMPLYLDEIDRVIQQCDLFVSIGTSGNVYPAAGLVQMANACGTHTVELNLEPAANVSSFREQIYGPATSIVPQFFEQL